MTLYYCTRIFSKSCKKNSRPWRSATCATQKRYQRHRTCAGERSYQAYGLADLQLRWDGMAGMASRHG